MMKISLVALALAAALPAHAGDHSDSHENRIGKRPMNVELGPRPFYLVQGMDEGKLKDRLMQCANGPFYKTDFSIGHRGAALQFPEHSDVSYMAGARMGAGIVECDVTFTSDGELVCRHSECDLATTTDIVTTPLAAQCTSPFTPAVLGAGGEVITPASATCCTSDISLAQFKTLKPKMDAGNRAVTTPGQFLGGTANWRTDAYTGHGHVVSFAESIELNKAMGVKHTPELKGATHQDRVDAIFGSQEGYAQAFIDTLKAHGVKPGDAFVQSFNEADVLYWIANEPAFAKQAVYLDSIDTGIPRLSYAKLKELHDNGVRIFSPPLWAMLAIDEHDNIVPSEYAMDVKKAGLDIIVWTFERADLRNGAANAGWYWQFDPASRAVKKDSDMYKALDVLARDVGILGIFSDWPATVTYYANCMGLK